MAGRQTVDRLKSFIESKPSFLDDIQADTSASRVEEHVIRNAAKGREIKHGSEAEKVKALRERVNREPDTLFLIVHDEAHFAAVPSNLTDRLLNSKDITSAKNVVLLQVSATPYCLLTRNSRVPKNNLVDMVLETQSTEDSNYYGIGKFVENSKLQEESNSTDLKPGILVDDVDFENLIKPTSDWSAYVRSLFKPETKESVVKNTIRFYGYLLQWISAVLTTVQLDSRVLKCRLAEFLGKSEMTSKVVANISGEDGKGSMVLLRFLKKEDGIYFAKLLREVRDAVNLSSDFAVGLDIDDDASSKEAAELCEKSFLPRLASWKGDANYRPTTYQDLADLPIILIVVEKGKMGITYPKSLRYYDLRMRYATTTATTRSAMEQDFGRACRYVAEGDPPLPTVLVSQAAKTQLQDHERRVLRSRQRQKKATGVFKLNPDYPKVMKPIGGGRRTDQEFPTSDFDLKPYRQRWEAAEKSCDFQNEETYPNRYILFGRPQIGKTGVFLHLAFLLWEKSGSPLSTGAPRTETKSLSQGESSFKSIRSETEENKSKNRGTDPSQKNVNQRREERLSTGPPEKEVERSKRGAEEDLEEPTPGKIQKRETSTSSSGSSDIDGSHQEQQPSDGEEALSREDRNVDRDVAKTGSATRGKETLPKQKGSKSKAHMQTSEDSESDKNPEDGQMAMMTAMMSFFLNAKQDWEREKVEKKQEKDDWRLEKEEWRREREEWKQEMELWNRERRGLEKEREEWKREREICKQAREEWKQEMVEWNRERNELKKEKEQLRREREICKQAREEWKQEMEAWKRAKTK